MIAVEKEIKGIKVLCEVEGSIARFSVLNFGSEQVILKVESDGLSCEELFEKYEINISKLL